MLQLWLENDGRTAHIVNDAGMKVASGAIVPVQGVADLIKAGSPGEPIEGVLYFQGAVV